MLTIKELKKCLDEEVKEIRSHQMWNTEINYIQKQKKIEAEKFADFIDFGFLNERKDFCTDGMALEKYPNESEQRKNLKMIFSVMTNQTSIKNIEKDFNYQAETQIWWKLFSLNTIHRLDLDKFDIVLSNFKDLYEIPENIHLHLTKLRKEAEEKILELETEVLDLEQIIEEANGFWYIDVELCTCNWKKSHDHYLESCKVDYRRLRDSDQNFCFEMFSPLQKHCLEIVRKLDERITMELSKINSQLTENHQKPDQPAKKSK